MSASGKFTVVNGELMHYKYLTKKWENGGWVYTYADSDQDAANKQKAKDRMAQLEKTRAANGEANRRKNEAEIAKSKKTTKKSNPNSAATTNTKTSTDPNSRLSLLDTEEGRAQVRRERMAAYAKNTTGDKKKKLYKQKATSFVNKYIASAK